MLRAVSLDLDDTLWPFAPVGEKIERATKAWLQTHAPRTGAWYSRAAFFELYAAMKAEATHDLGAMHQRVLRRMLADQDEDPDLAAPLYAVAHEARQQVEPYADALPALDRLAAAVPLVAITNGNFEPERLGLDRWMAHHVRADRLGIAKPAPEIFHHACALLDVPPGDVLHAGDDLAADVHGALDAGLQAAWVHRDLPGEAPAGALRFQTLTELADYAEASVAA